MTMRIFASDSSVKDCTIPEQMLELLQSPVARWPREPNKGQMVVSSLKLVGMEWHPH
jgi:hypothetical protein